MIMWSTTAPPEVAADGAAAADPPLRSYYSPRQLESSC
jgi:hypothetical protein